MKLRQDKNEHLRTFGAEAPNAPRSVVLDSAEVFQGHSEVVIRHNGRDYRLRRTRLGKLILTA